LVASVGGVSIEDRPSTICRTTINGPPADRLDDTKRADPSARERGDRVLDTELGIAASFVMPDARAMWKSSNPDAGSFDKVGAFRRVERYIGRWTSSVKDRRSARNPDGDADASENDDWFSVC